MNNATAYVVVHNWNGWRDATITRQQYLADMVPLFNNRHFAY